MTANTKELSANDAALELAHKRNDAYLKTLKDQRNAALDELAVVKSDNAALGVIVDRLKAQLQAAEQRCETSASDNANLLTELGALRTRLSAKEEELAAAVKSKSAESKGTASRVRKTAADTKQQH